MAQSLAAIAARADPAFNGFATARGVESLRQELARATTLETTLRTKPQLAEMLLNDGQIEAALRELDEYERLLAEHRVIAPPEDDARVNLIKAIAHLRRGELENCLHHHNPDSCLLPIQGGGVHVQQDGARAAVEILTRVLHRHPQTLEAAWLLNIAYMTLGQYPDQMPRRWMIAPRYFAAEYDLPRFPDVAGSLGLAIDDVAGGVVLDDFDNDGWLDLMVSASGFRSPLRVFRNQGDGAFAEYSAAAGLTGLTGGLNLLQADYNNDGWVDVLVLRGGWMGPKDCFPNSLLRNNGDGTFTDVTEEARLLSFHPTQTAVWLDYNHDGWIDVFIGNESRAGQEPVHPCELFRNNGDGTFTECAAAHGVAITAFVKAVSAGDFNRDGRPDLYVSVQGAANRLLRNDGPADGEHAATAAWRFTDVAAAAGVSEPLYSFPCWFWDYDDDGWPDIFVSGYGIRDVGDVGRDYLGLPHGAERARLFRNRGDGTFADVTVTAGLFKVIHAMGCNFGDLDGDGWLDFYAGTGDPFLGTLIPNRMFRNDAGRRFQEVTTSGGFGQLQKGHGIAFGDINHDGAQDVYAVTGGAYPSDHYPNQLFANPGHGRHGLKLKLEGVQSNRSAIGAVITVVVRTAVGERALHRTVGSGGSFGASPLRQEIGLGAAEQIVRVEIFWPRTGGTQVITGLALDRCYTIREGAATAQEVGLTSFAWPRASSSPAPQHLHRH